MFLSQKYRQMNLFSVISTKKTTYVLTYRYNLQVKW